MKRVVRIFVASSSENLPAAHALCTVLGKVRNTAFQVVPAAWDQGTFKLSTTFIESLEVEMDRADFAVFLLTPNDVTRIRNQEMMTPRDNVLFELGLFFGRLQRERCYMLYQEDEQPKLPTDLLGVGAATYKGPTPSTGAGAADTQDRLRAELERALMPACKEICDRVAEILSSSFVAQLEGDWWERIQTKAGYELSFFTVIAGDKYTSLHMGGDHFDGTGELIGGWKSVVVGIQEVQRKLFYYWEGDHPPTPDGNASKVQGFGTLEFDQAIAHLEEGKGGFMDVDPNAIGTAQWKTVRIKRVSNQKYVYTMTQGRLADKKALVSAVLDQW